MKAPMVRFVLRSGLTVAAMLALYAVIPIPGQRVSLTFTAIMAVAGLAGLGYAFLTLARRARSSSDQRAVRLEALIAVLYAFVVFMSLVYLALSSTSGQFTGLHTRIDAIYFTTSTIATVGFGDIHATGQVSRALVTVQMFCDLVFVALVARIILPSVVSARERARQQGPSGSSTEVGDDHDVPTTR